MSYERTGKGGNTTYCLNTPENWADFHRLKEWATSGRRHMDEEIRARQAQEDLVVNKRLKWIDAR